MFKRAKLWVRLLAQARETPTLLHDQSAEASFVRTANNASDAAAHSTAETINTSRPGFNGEAEDQRRACLCDARRCADQSEELTVVLLPVDRERNGAARNRQNAVAGTMKNGKHCQSARNVAPCRPSEIVVESLLNGDIGAFVKEDGAQVTSGKRAAP